MPKDGMASAGWADWRRALPDHGAVRPQPFLFRNPDIVTIRLPQPHMATFEQLVAREPIEMLRQNVAWRQDFLENPDDFSAGDDTRRAWREQIDMMRAEIRRRCPEPSSDDGDVPDPRPSDHAAWDAHPVDGQGDAHHADGQLGRFGAMVARG